MRFQAIASSSPIFPIKFCFQKSFSMNALRRGSNSPLKRRLWTPLSGCSVTSSIRGCATATQQRRINIFLWSDDCHALCLQPSITSAAHRWGLHAWYSTAVVTPWRSLWRYPATLASELSCTVRSLVQDLTDWALWHMSSTLKKRRKKMSRHKWKKRRKLNRMKTKHKSK